MFLPTAEDCTRAHRKKLVVAFHDLHEGNYRLCEDFLLRLERIGVDRSCLLTVPRWHNGTSACDNSRFCEWLRSAASSGHEAVLHGYNHMDEQPLSLYPPHILVSRFYTAGEGEFYRLPENDARRKLIRGQEIISNCGIEPSGFIAPAWLLNRTCMPLLSEMGFAYTTTLARIVSLQEDRSIFAPTISFTSRSSLRRCLSEIWSRRMARLTANARILRIAVHPVDFRHGNIAEAIYRLVRLALEERDVCTYSDLIGESA